MKKHKKQAPEQLAPGSDEHYACIAGYTEGGVHNGVTRKAMEAAECSAVDGAMLWLNPVGLKP